jgi:hypothetical protein
MYVNSLTRAMNRNMLFPGDEEPRRFPYLRTKRHMLFLGDEKSRRFPYPGILIIAVFALGFGLGFMRVSVSAGLRRTHPSRFLAADPARTSAFREAEGPGSARLKQPQSARGPEPFTELDIASL